MMGEFIKKLRDTGVYEESLIFFLSDHGHPLADHGKFLKGPDRLHSELLKVPFGFKLPGQDHAGCRIKQIAQFPDMLPTLMDAAGMGNNACAMQGSSLMAMIRGEVDHIRTAAISGFHAGEDRCIRDETWSLVLRPGNQADELYNLVDDPLEHDNIIEQHRDIACMLSTQFGSVYAVARRPFKGLQGSFEVADTPAG